MPDWLPWQLVQRALQECGFLVLDPRFDDPHPRLIATKTGVGAVYLPIVAYQIARESIETRNRGVVGGCDALAALLRPPEPGR